MNNQFRNNNMDTKTESSFNIFKYAALHNLENNIIFRKYKFFEPYCKVKSNWAEKIIHFFGNDDKITVRIMPLHALLDHGGFFQIWFGKKISQQYLELVSYFSNLLPYQNHVIGTACGKTFMMFCLETNIGLHFDGTDLFVFSLSIKLNCDNTTQSDASQVQIEGYVEKVVNTSITQGFKFEATKNTKSKSTKSCFSTSGSYPLYLNGILNTVSKKILRITDIDDTDSEINRETDCVLNDDLYGELDDKPSSEVNSQSAGEPVNESDHEIDDSGDESDGDGKKSHNFYIDPDL